MSDVSNKRTIDHGNGWKIEEYVNNSDNFSRFTRYFYKGKRAPRVEIRSKIARQLAGYALIEKDLRNVLVWLDEIEDVFPKNEQLKQSFISRIENALT